MGWFWGGNKNNEDDPTKTLSPDLKEFLKHQQPRPYVPAAAPPRKPVEEPEQSRSALPDANETFEGRSLPRESLFQDGRYKEIWKTYIPQTEIEAMTSSPLERIIAARKDRQTLLRRATMENCAFEEEIKMNCFSRGGFKEQAMARMTMCAQEYKAFNRCYQLQSKFLIALGYMTSSTSTDEEEERIQMHADRLYHKMMDYEASVEEAKLKREAIPPLSSVFNPTRAAPSLEQIDLPKGLEKMLKKPLHELPPHERELAARAVLQEAKLVHVYGADVQKYATVMNEQRKERQTWVSKVLGEPIGKFIVGDPPKEPEVRPYPMADLDRKVWQENEFTTQGATSANGQDSQVKN